MSGIKIIDGQHIRDKTFILDFGKYRGWTLQKVFYNNPGYIVWLSENGMLIEDHLLERAKDATARI